MSTDALTITVRLSAGSFIASTSGDKPQRVQHMLCPRQAALDLAEKLWGKGDHIAYCSEIHPDSHGANYLLTRAEVAHVA